MTRRIHRAFRANTEQDLDGKLQKQVFDVSKYVLVPKYRKRVPLPLGTIDRRDSHCGGACSQGLTLIERLSEEKT